MYQALLRREGPGDEATMEGNVSYQGEISLHFDLPSLPYMEPVAKGVN